MIQIPKEILVGKFPHAQKTLPSSEIVPVGTYAVDTKRMNTLTKRATTTESFANEELPGFTLISNRGFSWNSTHTKWEVIDPRGYRVELSAENISQIVHCAGITEGLIQEKCVWSRDGAHTILLPVNSKPYQTAKHNTAITDKRVHLSKVKPGDEIRLHNKAIGIYLGSCRMIRDLPLTYDDDRITSNVAKLNKTYVLRMKDNSGNTYYHISPSIKVSEILNSLDTALSDDEIETELNSYINPLINKGTTCIVGRVEFNDKGTMNYDVHQSRKDILLFTKQKGKPVTAIKEITKECYFEKLIKLAGFGPYMTTRLIGKIGNQYYLHCRGRSKYDTVNDKNNIPDTYRILLSPPTQDGDIEFVSSSKQSYYSYSRSYCETVDHMVSTFDKWYAITTTIGGKTYEF